MEADAKGILRGLVSESSDVGMILAVIGILVAMVLPIPPFLLNFLIALNITIAIIVLITVMYAQSPLDFSIFPSMLLVLTLFRLSLNVATTRLILMHGNEGQLAAGSIIRAFGHFVVGGNYVIGMIIFIILVLINFIVITKGSGRIAEVAARFALDGMPGKQMAIDADLNAGIIDETEAKNRREEISNESKFHGAMDGASKFVRGDAIAGIIITLVNIIGGFVIGVFQQNMSMVTAARNYTLLTIGDGLVSQIPALIISTSAGILVARAASNDRMGKEFSRHIFANAQPIYIGSFVVFLFGLVPGLPTVPFMGLSLILGSLVYFFQRRRAALSEMLPESDGAEEAEAVANPEDVEHLLTLDTMELEVGYGLIPLVDRDQDGSLLGRIRGIRRQFATEMGIIIPPIHIRDNLKMKPASYRMVIRGVEMAQGELMVNHLLAMDPGDVAQKIDGVPTTEPAFHLPALWIPPEREEEAKFSGYTVVDNSTVVATHLTEIIRENAPDLLGRQEVQQLLDNLARTNPKAVEELVPGILPLGIVQKVLQNLLRERVSVRDLLTIVETLADYGTMSRDPELLTEYVRQKLARSIISPFLQSGGVLPVITLDHRLEEDLGSAVRHTEQGSYLSTDPSTVEAVMAAVNQEISKCGQTNLQPILLTSPVLRRHLRKLVESVAAAAMVISHAEIFSNIRIQSIGKVGVNNAG